MKQLCDCGNERHKDEHRSYPFCERCLKKKGWIKHIDGSYVVSFLGRFAQAVFKDKEVLATDNMFEYFVEKDEDD